jgi:hypothetical protein
VKNLNDLLARRDAPQHFFSERLLLDPRDEILGDLEIDVRFQQGEPHLPHRVVDVRLADRSVTTEIFENVLKLIAQLRKHDEQRSSSCCPYFFFGAAVGLAAGVAGAGVAGPSPAPDSSILNDQCVSTFFPPDFALTITVQVLSRSFCVTW